MKHRCHNREFPETTTVQDGWREVSIHGHAAGGIIGYVGPQKVRVPRMVVIPFEMTRECHQWDEPYGAIHEGVTDPAGCEGCKWKPKDSFTKEIRVRLYGGEPISGINGDNNMFILPFDLHLIESVMFRVLSGEQAWVAAEIEVSNVNNFPIQGDHVRYHRRMD